jgi:adenosylmethionine-8-amino-7-oxononanoate aminotransferase
MLFDQPKIETHYCYRCPYGLEKPSCGIRCAAELEKTIRRIGPQYVAAFVADPMVGSTVGALVPPDEYWPMVREICSRYDVLLIADEVMTGCGRTGKNFCVDHWGVKPDLIATAKGLAASYYPVGAVIVSDHVGEVFRNGSGVFAHSHTFNGMPAASAAVVAVLEYMKKHGLVENAARMGKLIEMEIAPELQKMPLVGEVRGKGLMWGIELVRDKETRAPFDAAEDAGGKLKALALERGMTLYPGKAMADGVNGDNIMIGPPLTAGEKDVRKIFEILTDSLQSLQKQLKF